MRIDFTIDNTPGRGDFLTSEAVASMIGQTPRLTVDFHYARPGPKVRVIAAAVDGNTITLTVDVPDDAVRRFGLGDDTQPGGIGYSLGKGAPRLDTVGPINTPDAPRDMLRPRPPSEERIAALLDARLFGTGYLRFDYDPDTGTVTETRVDPVTVLVHPSDP